MVGSCFFHSKTWRWLSQCPALHIACPTGQPHGNHIHAVASDSFRAPIPGGLAGHPRDHFKRRCQRALSHSTIPIWLRLCLDTLCKIHAQSSTVGSEARCGTMPKIVNVVYHGTLITLSVLNIASEKSRSSG